MNRWALAIILAYVAAFGVPKSVQPVLPVPSISTPSSTMRAAVADVTAAMRQATPDDRNLFADVWLKAARGLDGEADQQLVPDTRVLREYARIAATVGWKRIGGLSGKYAGLDAACNSAFGSVIGLDIKPVDGKLREQFAQLCEALAWAAIQR
jgi:hypothetical protein